jgi:CubicO group peptidase (beta-lactamase class C family)
VDDQLIFAKSYGHADIESQTPATNHHVYRIGSITKQFTGLMLLKLIESGDARLADPVINYVPELNRVRGRFENSPPITLVQLATMTSGLAREPANLATHLKGSVADWQDTLLTALPDTSYRHEPDTRYAYSNVGYAILGVALSRASGRGYVEYVESEIFQPMGMTHTAFEPNDAIRDRIAKGYTLRNGQTDGADPAREHAGRGYKVPNGAMYTTVADLAKFLAFQLGFGPDEVLPRDFVEDNLSRASSTNGSLDTGYGIGFGLLRHEGLVMTGHGGSVAGYNAAAYVHRPTKTGAIVLRNVGGGAFSTKDLCRNMLASIAKARTEQTGQ